MKKTAMMELIEELQHILDHDTVTIHARKCVQDCIDKAIAKLPAERQNIEDAYKVGHEDGVDDDEPYQSDYFTQTYEQK